MPDRSAGAATQTVPPISMGVLMQRSGVARQTIHFYLRKGLLPRPRRTSRTYALYSPETVDLLDIVKECQTELRLSLDEIVKIFAHANYDPRQIRGELELRKAAARPAQETSSGPRVFTAEEMLASLEPAPPAGWIEELRRQGLVRSRADKYSPESAELVRAIWELCQLGLKLDDLKTISKRIEEQTEAELSVFRHALDPKRLLKGDYGSAIRLLNALDQFAHWNRKTALRHQFSSKAYRSADIFVGPNEKHVFPSETFLAKRGLNREIDRLLNHLDQNPDDKKSLRDLARAYYLRSDWLNLHGVSERILQIDPLNVRATADLTRAMYYLGRINDAVNLLEQRLRTGSDPLLKFRLGQCLVLRAKHGGIAELLSAVMRKQQLAAEALREVRDQGSIRRWISLDVALDNLSVSDPLQLNQPSVEELETLHQEYQSISDKGLSPLSKMSLAMGRILAAYALFLVYRRHRHPKAEQLRRKIIQMDPHGVLAARPVQASGQPAASGNSNARRSAAEQAW
ncbi:MAG: MerR family transcriptional regulator [Acidobacteriia bacterium]|nr:MerR family transcriptional regulator [Terriglobia bacterium]